MPVKKARNSSAAPTPAAVTNRPEGPLDAVVVEAPDDGPVLVVVANGRQRVEVRVPHHIDRQWLAAAVALAPVDAVVAMPAPSGEPVLWGVFPGEAHRDVVVDLNLRGRRVVVEGDSIQLKCEKAHVRLDKSGNVEVRGKDVLTRAARLNRIKGGAVSIN